MDGWRATKDRIGHEAVVAIDHAVLRVGHAVAMATDRRQADQARAGRPEFRREPPRPRTVVGHHEAVTKARVARGRATAVALPVTPTMSAVPGQLTVPSDAQPRATGAVRAPAADRTGARLTEPGHIAVARTGPVTGVATGPGRPDPAVPD
jgi:hypothetical protein